MSSSHNDISEELAELELKSFKYHSLARSYPKKSYGYFSNYSKFHSSRSKIDQLFYEISPEAADLASVWFSNASQMHDLAEDLGEQHTTSPNWQFCEESLVLYFTIILLEKSNIDRKAITSLLYSATTRNYKEIILASLLLKKNDCNELFALSQRLGNLEMKLWFYHHEREYQKFIESKAMQLSELGYTSSNAMKAAEALAEASKDHDDAESEELVISNKTDTFWQEALQFLLKYYRILISKPAHEYFSQKDE